MTWRELKEAWTYANISDSEFIQLADGLGRGHIARDIVQEDLEIPG